MMNSEKGQALSLVLIAIAIGALVIPPFLNHTGTSLIGSKTYAREIGVQYAADSGAEHSIWNLMYGEIIDSLTFPGDNVSYALDESINGLPVNVSVVPDYEIIAIDDFENGGWTGGSGWLAGWWHSGNAAVTTSGMPYSGSYHLRLTSSDGYIDRAVDLSGYSSVHLQFRAKANSFEAGDEAYCLVSADGIDWDTAQAWVDGNDDNIYHFYDIDLSAFPTSSQFYIAFDTQMSDTSDYLYIDNIAMVVTTCSYIAGEDFESDGWTGGSGWLYQWWHSGRADITPSGSPHSGDYHLRLRSSNGYIDRAVNLSGRSGVHLQFWAKTNSFEAGEAAYCLVSPDGSAWHTIQTWVDGDDDDTYRFYNLDLSEFDMSGEFFIAFDAQMSNSSDYLYIDDIKIVVPGTYDIDSEAGDISLDVKVNLQGDPVSILSWQSSKKPKHQ